MPLRSLPPHIAAKIIIREETGCWIFNGKDPSSNGYQRCWLWGTRWQAHRLVYELIKKTDIRKLQLDHKCRDRACCNPEHLQPVTGSVNCKFVHSRGSREKIFPKRKK